MRKVTVFALLLGSALAGTGAPAVGEGLRLEGPEGVAWWFGLGSFKGENTPGKLEGQSSRLAGHLGVGGEVSPRSPWMFTGELLGYTQRYDTPTSVTPPVLGTISDRADVATFGLVVGARYQLPMWGVRWYGGGGGGLYRSRLSVSGSVFGFPGTREEVDNGLGWHAEAGLSVPVSAGTELGLSLRQVWLRSDFGEITGGSVDIGGSFVFLGLRYGM